MTKTIMKRDSKVRFKTGKRTLSAPPSTQFADRTFSTPINSTLPPAEHSPNIPEFNEWERVKQKAENATINSQSHKEPLWSRIQGKLNPIYWRSNS